MDNRCTATSPIRSARFNDIKIPYDVTCTMTTHAMITLGYNVKKTD